MVFYPLPKKNGVIVDDHQVETPHSQLMDWNWTGNWPSTNMVIWKRSVDTLWLCFYWYVIRPMKYTQCDVWICIYIYIFDICIYEYQLRVAIASFVECRLNTYWKRAACGCHIYTLSKDLHHFSFLGNSSVSHLPRTAMSIKCAELFVTWVSRVCVCMYINT